jgi:drug/metabolite transporter (DMT)-like permease
MQPLFVLPLALVFLGSLPTPVEAIGGGAIMVGAMWMGRIHARRHAQAVAPE